MVRRIEGVPHVLLILDPYGRWGLPKGHLEGRETAAAAALREVREETGLEDVEMGSEVGTIDWYFRWNEDLIHKYCTFFLMTSEEGETEPATDEGISDCAWLPVAEAIRTISYGNAREMVEAAARLLEGAHGPSAESG